MLLLASITLSCSRTYNLTPNDYAWMPYKGNETLIFNSNIGDTDTIFFLKKDTFFVYSDPLAVNGIKYEEVAIFCQHSDPSPPDGKHRYLESYFMHINKSKDKKARLEIELSAKDAWFYRIGGPRIDSLESIRPMVLKTKTKVYDDVFIIEDEDWMNFKQRSDYVTKAYWSKSEGLVRYDKQNNVFWELTKKYNH